MGSARLINSDFFVKMKTAFTLLLAAILATGLRAQQAPVSTPTAKPSPTPKVYKAPVFPPIPTEDLAAIQAGMPAKSTAQPKQPRKVLLFWRAEGFVHPSIPYGVEALKQLGDKTGAYTSVSSDDMAVFDPETLKQFDAVAFISTTQLKFENPVYRKALLDFVASGKGIVGIHAATDNFPTWPEGQELMGGVFHGHPWHAGDMVAIKIDEPSHPLNQAFNNQGFRLHEEIYQITGPYGRDKQRELVSLDMSKPENQRTVDKNNKPLLVRTDNDFPISWIKKEGSGRVFYTSLGHNKDIFFVPQILMHFLDGIQYALGDLPADDVPTATLKIQPTPVLAPDGSTETLQKVKAAPEPPKQKVTPAAATPTPKTALLIMTHSASHACALPANSPAKPATAATAPMTPDAAKASGEASLKDLPKYNYGDSTKAPNAVLEAIRVSSPAERLAIEPKLLAILSDASAAPAAKDSIMRWLGWMGSDLSVPVLVGIATSPNGDAAAYAIRALSTIPSSKSDAALLELLKTVPDDRKVTVIAALGLRRSTNAVSALGTIASGQSQELSAAALNSLAAIASNDALQEILKASPGGNPDVKSRALIAAASNYLSGTKGDQEILSGPVGKALGEIMLSSSPSASGVTLSTAAARLLVPKNGAPSPGVISLLKSEDYRRREGAARAIAQAIPVSELVKIEWSSYPDASVVVLDSIAEKATPEDLSLFQAALSSTNSRIECAAITGIGACAVPTTLEILLPIASGTNSEFSYAASNALASSKFSGGNEKLLASYNNSTEAATRALLLGIMASRQQHEAFKPAIAATKSTEPLVCSAAYAALSKLSARGDLADVSALLENVPSSSAQNLRTAVVRAAIMDPSPSDAAKKLSAAYVKAGAKQKEDLVNILAMLTVPESVATLQGILGGQDVEQRKVVIRALSAARNKTAYNLLPHVAETGSTESEKILSLKGYIDTIGALDDISPQKKVADYRIAWKFATRDEEKSAIRAAVKKILARNPDAEVFLKQISVENQPAAPSKPSAQTP